ncbi:MAG: sugar ABC transporter ATP-binding protein [Alkalispirochaetaceae bacterium]
MKTLVEIKGLTKTYPGVQALDDVSFSIQENEVHALVGENGAGKSTVIKILAGVVQPNGGTITIDGEDQSFHHPLDALKKGVAVTYQDLSLFPNLSVAENIGISRILEAGGVTVDWGEMRRIAKEALDELNVEMELDRRLRYLSIGSQNLVAIARAIVHDAKVLILDEPTASLAREDIDALFKIINMLKDRGMGILFVSHKLDEVFAIGDRVTVLRDGEHVSTTPREKLTEEKLVSDMVGRPIRFTRYESRPAGEVLLELNNLSKKNNFKDISFSLGKGEILGITGLVGSGRSELAQAIFGKNEPDSGEITLLGKPVWFGSTEEAMKHGVAYIPESRHTQGLILGKTLTDNVTATILKRITTSLGLIDRGKQKSTVQEWIKKLNIKPAYPRMVIDQFSGGNQQKAVIAKWLAYNPTILIVDEPTHGIDIGAKAEIHRLLRDLSQSGIGVIMISSELPEVLAVSDRILVMRRGRIAGEFKADSVEQQEVMNIALGAGSRGAGGKETEA